MMVTSEMTALSAIRIAANTGSPMRASALPLADSPDSVRPARRPSPRKAITGITIVPMAPIGSRMKIFVSSHVSFNRPRMSVPDGMAGQPEEDVLEIRHDGPEVRDADPVLRHAVDDGGDQFFAASVDRIAMAGTRHRDDRRQLPEPWLGGPVLSGDDDRPLRAVLRDETIRCVDVDDPRVLDDRDAVAEP